MKKLLTLSVFCTLAMSMLSCAMDNKDNKGTGKKGRDHKKSERCNPCKKCR